MSKAQLFRVTCPYCFFGAALVEVRRQRGAHSVDKSPRQCDKCDRYFDIEVRVNLRGVPLQVVDRNKAIRKSLEALVIGDM